MNARKLILFGTAVVIVALALYPPFVFRNGEALIPVGYGWIGQPPDTVSVDGVGMEINAKVLIVEWLGAMLVGGLIYWAVGTKSASKNTDLSNLLSPGPDSIRRPPVKCATPLVDQHLQDEDTSETRSGRNADAWPKFSDFEQSERGYNAYQDAWVGRRRRSALLQDIPMSALEGHRDAVSLAQRKGWRDSE